MKTILFDKTTKQVIGQVYHNGYKSMYPQGILPDNIIEIPVIDTPEPEYNAATQNISLKFQVIKGKYVQVWTITDKTEFEVNYPPTQSDGMGFKN